MAIASISWELRESVHGHFPSDEKNSLLVSAYDNVIETLEMWDRSLALGKDAHFDHETILEKNVSHSKIRMRERHASLTSKHDLSASVKHPIVEMVTGI